MGTGKVKNLPPIVERKEWAEQIDRQLVAAGKALLPAGSRVFQFGQLRIVLMPPVAHSILMPGQQSQPKAKGYRLSIAHPDRMPSWAEIRAARDHLLPHHLNFAMPIPAKGDEIPNYTVLLIEFDMGVI